MKVKGFTELKTVFDIEHDEGMFYIRDFAGAVAVNESSGSFERFYVKIYGKDGMMVSVGCSSMKQADWLVENLMKADEEEASKNETFYIFSKNPFETDDDEC